MTSIEKLLGAFKQKGRGLGVAYAVAAALFVGSPYIPNALIRWTAGTMLGSAALMLLALAALRVDIGLSIAAFLGIAALFLEQRRRLIAKFQHGIASGQTKETPGKVGEASRPASDIIDGEHHPDEEHGREEEHPFKPSDESEMGNDAEDIGSDKHPLHTAGQDTEHIEQLMESKGFASP